MFNFLKKLIQPKEYRETYAVDYTEYPVTPSPELEPRRTEAPDLHAAYRRPRDDE